MNKILLQGIYCVGRRQKNSCSGMEDCKPMVSPVKPDITNEEVRKAVALSTEEHGHYRSTVGSLLYIETKLRPDIAFAASILSPYVIFPTTVNGAQTKRAR